DGLDRAVERRVDDAGVDRLAVIEVGRPRAVLAPRPHLVRLDDLYVAVAVGHREARGRGGPVSVEGSTVLPAEPARVPPGRQTQREAIPRRGEPLDGRLGDAQAPFVG